MSCHVEKPKTRKKRIKRFIPAINFLGVIVNGIRLDKLGSKVDLLLRNQVLQEDKINHVANYLNRTMVKVATMGRNQVEIISYIKHIGETMTKMAKEHTNHEFLVALPRSAVARLLKSLWCLPHPHPPPHPK